jgi:hypothetical protein
LAQELLLVIAGFAGIIWVHPGFLWVIFVSTITYRERNNAVNRMVSSIGGGYKSRPPQ